MKLIRLFLTIALAAMPAAISAQQQSMVDEQIERVSRDNKVIFIDGKQYDDSIKRHHVDSIRALISDFYYDQFRHFQDPDAPYFLFMSKDAQLAMGIGGCVRLRGYYDWGGAIYCFISRLLARFFKNEPITSTM